MTLAIDRPGAGASTVQVTLSASPDDTTRTIVGIVPFDTATVQLPFQVDIDTGQIGGPSAGLAFTLTLIDELSKGDLTGGKDVAVTGEIELDGSVGPIGGLAQKVSAVRQAGVHHFLVPTAQGEQQIARAREIGGDDVEIIPVGDARRGARRPGQARRRPGGTAPSTDCRERRRWHVYARDVAISFSRPDPSSPASVADAAFGTARRGFDQQEVRDFLRMVAAELARLQERERFLERELRSAQASPRPAVGELDDESATRMLGEEAARILQTAREGSASIRVRAEDGAAQLLREAGDDARRMREEADVEAGRKRADAVADAEAELSMAKQQGREMVEEARAYRERVLGELARRRDLARQQLEQLVHGRDRLLQAFERARLVAVDVVAELTPLGAPDEYVDLTPTTGPVPIMVPTRPIGEATSVDDIVVRMPEPEPEPEPAVEPELEPRARRRPRRDRRRRRHGHRRRRPVRPVAGHPDRAGAGRGRARPRRRGHALPHP